MPTRANTGAATRRPPGAAPTEKPAGSSAPVVDPPWQTESIPAAPPRPGSARPVRVSVLMPVYNAENYLVQALGSIREQTFREWELVAVDDGSTDSSLKILRLASAQDRRIRVLSRPNTGIIGALNDGLAVCRGPYIARMDADDTCLADRLAKQVAYLDAHPKCVAVGTWLHRTDPDGNPAGTEEPPIHHQQIDRVLLTGNASSIVHASAMIRRSALQAIGGWNPAPDRDGVEDLDLFLRLAERGELANIPEPLYVYRRHLSSICAKNYQKMVQGVEQVIAETWKRRRLPGQPDLSEFRLRVAATWRPADFFRSWACHALKAGNKRAALRHACSALWRQPWCLASWRTLAWAVRG